MNYYYFAQSVYGNDNYGSSLYGADETSSQTQANGLINTGSPVFWGGVVGASLIIATIIAAIAAARNRRRENKNNKDSNRV